MENLSAQNKRTKFLRPIAWMFTCLSVWILPLAGELICNLGSFIINYLNHFSTLAIVILVMLFGGLYISLFFYSATLLPYILVSASNWIYPTHKALRYYFVGIYLIIVSSIFLLFGILGFIEGGEMFWFYVRYAWVAFSSVMLILYGAAKK